MSTLVEPPPAQRERSDSLKSTRTLNFTVFTPKAAATLPLDDELTVDMYNPENEVTGDNEIIIIPNVAGSDTKLSKDKSKHVVNGIDGSEQGAGGSNSTVYAAKGIQDDKRDSSAKNRDSYGNGAPFELSKDTGIINGIADTSTWPRKEDSTGIEKVRVTRSQTSTMTKSTKSANRSKVGAFEIKSSHSSTSMPKGSSQALNDMGFKSSLMSTLERRSAGGKNDSKTAHQMASKTVSVATNNSSKHSSASVSKAKNTTESAVVSNEPQSSDTVLNTSNGTAYAADSLVNNGPSSSNKNGDNISTTVETDFINSKTTGISSEIKPVSTSTQGNIIDEDVSVTSESSAQAFTENLTSSVELSEQITKNTRSDGLTEVNLLLSEDSPSQVERITSTKSTHSDPDTSHASRTSVVKGGVTEETSESNVTVLSDNDRTLNENTISPRQELKFAALSVTTDAEKGAPAGLVNQSDTEASHISEHSSETRTHRDADSVITTQSVLHIGSATSEQNLASRTSKEVSGSNTAGRDSNIQEKKAVSRPSSFSVNKTNLGAENNKQLGVTIPVASEINESTQSKEKLFSPGRVKASKSLFERQNGSKSPSSPLSPATVEAQGAVKSGIVGKLALELKDIPLTGRSIDASTLERNKKKENHDSSSGQTNTVEKKQPKFLVEGIDIPAAPKSESPEVESSDTLQSGTSLDSVPESSESTLKKSEKRGFTYVLDKSLQSEIVKKAEKVTASRPHEVVATRTLEHAKDTGDKDTESLQRARSQLHKVKVKRKSEDRGKSAAFQAEGLQVALKKSLLSEIRTSVDKKEATAVGIAGKKLTNNTRTEAGEPDVSDLEQDIAPEIVPTEPKSPDQAPNSFWFVHSNTNVQRKSGSHEDKDRRSSSVKTDSKTVSSLQVSKSSKSDNTDREINQSVPDSAYQSNPSNPTSPAFEFDIKAGNRHFTPAQQEMVVQRATGQVDGPQGQSTSMYKAEKSVKSSFSSKVSGQPEKKASSEQRENYQWERDANGEVTASGSVQQSMTDGNSRQSSSVTYSVPNKNKAIEVNNNIASTSNMEQQNGSESTLRSNRGSLLNDGPAPAMAQLQAVEMDIDNRNGYASTNNLDVSAPNVKHVQSMFETQMNTMSSSNGQTHEELTPPVATSSLQRNNVNRNTPDTDVNFQNLTTIRSNYERGPASAQDASKPNEPFDFQNLQAIKTRFEYDNWGVGQPNVNTQPNPMIRVDEATQGAVSVPTQQPLKVSTYESSQQSMSMQQTSTTVTNQAPAPVLQQQQQVQMLPQPPPPQPQPQITESQPHKRRRHQRSGMDQEGGYASSSEGATQNLRVTRVTPTSFHEVAQPVNAVPFQQSYSAPSSNLLTVANGNIGRHESYQSNTSRVTQNVVRNESPATLERVLTPHLREAKEENGRYHIKMDLNQSIKQAINAGMSTSLTREEMMQRHDYHANSSNRMYSTGRDTYPGTMYSQRSGSGVSQQMNGYEQNTNTMNSYYSQGGRAVTPVSIGNGPRPEFLMGVNQTMTFDYVPKEDTNRHDTTNINRIYLENDRQQHRTTGGDGYTVKSMSRTDRIPYIEHEVVDNQRHVERVNVDQHEDTQMPMVRGSILIKNSIDTTGAPKVVDVVEDTFSEGDFHIEDNTNVFDQRYLTQRENPMYSSDPDLTNPALYETTERQTRGTRYRSVPVRHDTTSTSWAFGRPSESDQYTSESREYEIRQQRGRPHGHRVRREERVETRYHDDVDGYRQDREDGMYEEGFTETWEETRRMRGEGRGGGRGGGAAAAAGGGAAAGGASSSSASRTVTSSSMHADLARLLRDAPADSVKQTINVEREEEDIVGPLPMSHADGSASEADGMLNFDAISEKVNLGVQDGKAQLAVKVRCERVVPVYGEQDLYKKSSVIVTRLIEVDMEVTEERRRLYENIMRGGTKQGMIEYGGRHSAATRKLTTKETFNLYKTFMGLAEEHEGQQQEMMHIEKQVEDDRGLDIDAADDEVRQISSRTLKPSDSDAVSYMSATEADTKGGILY